MIVTAVDERYLRREGFALIQSCARHAPEQRFHLHLVNAPASIDDEIRRWHPAITIEHAALDVPAARHKGRMCCARTEPLRRVLHEQQEPTVYLDSDIVLRAPIDALFDELEEVDLLVKHRPSVTTRGPLGTPHAGKFNSGVIALRPSPAGLRFVDRYADAVAERIASGRPIDRVDDGVYTAADQELLYLTWLELRDQIAFAPLPTRFNDSAFQADSPIWHGKGTARLRWAYRREHARYGGPLARVTNASRAARAVLASGAHWLRTARERVG